MLADIPFQGILLVPIILRDIVGNVYKPDGGEIRDEDPEFFSLDPD